MPWLQLGKQAALARGQGMSKLIGFVVTLFWFQKFDLLQRSAKQGLKMIWPMLFDWPILNHSFDTSDIHDQFSKTDICTNAFGFFLETFGRQPKIYTLLTCPLVLYIEKIFFIHLFLARSYGMLPKVWSRLCPSANRFTNLPRRWLPLCCMMQPKSISCESLRMSWQGAMALRAACSGRSITSLVHQIQFVFQSMIIPAKLTMACVICASTAKQRLLVLDHDQLSANALTGKC